jgi:hypothetical protein
MQLTDRDLTYALPKSYTHTARYGQPICMLGRTKVDFVPVHRQLIYRDAIYYRTPEDESDPNC